VALAAALAVALEIALCAPAVALAGWLAVGLPLLLAGELTPALTIALAVVVTVPALLLAATGVAGSAGSARGRRDVSLGLPLLLTFAVAAGFAAIAWSTASEHVVVRRDPAVYAQTADWLSRHGDLPVPAQPALFGHTPGLTYGSPGFYSRGDDVVPQFMSGTPIALAPAGWAGGLRGITRADAVLGGLAVLAVAGLARRLAGCWAGLLAALGTALAYPDLHQARSAFSEPSAQLLLFGGLALLVDAGRRRAARLQLCSYALAGLVIGMVSLVRIDALVELVAFVPVLVLLAVRDRIAAAISTALGIAVAVSLGLTDGYVETRPYISSLGHQLHLTVAAAVLVTGITAIATWLWRRGAWSRTALRRLVAPAAATLVLAAAAAAYFVLPRVAHPTYPATDPATADITALEAHLGLPSATARTFAEQSMHWLGWWIGPSGLLLAVVALAALVHRIAGQSDHAGLPFAFVLLAATAVVIGRPSITPDHPWADRRFVPVVLPGLIVVCAWFVATVARWLRARQDRFLAAGAAGALAAALLVPAVIGSFALFGRSTERGELAAVNTLCGALPARAAVLVTGTRAVQEWTQVIRGDCGVPVAVTTTAPTTATAAAAVRGRGLTPVVVADTPAALAQVGAGDARHIVHLQTHEADHQLVHRPARTRRLTIDVWLGAAP
jgi:hypothetical protein